MTNSKSRKKPVAKSRGLKFFMTKLKTRKKPVADLVIPRML